MPSTDTEIDIIAADVAADVDLRRELADSHVGEVLDQLDAELVGLGLPDRYTIGVIAPGNNDRMVGVEAFHKIILTD